MQDDVLRQGGGRLFAQLRPLRRLGSAFTDDGSSVFLTKINYWLPM